MCVLLLQITQQHVWGVALGLPRPGAAGPAGGLLVSADGQGRHRGPGRETREEGQQELAEDRLPLGAGVPPAPPDLRPPPPHPLHDHDHAREETEKYVECLLFRYKMFHLKSTK